MRLSGYATALAFTGAIGAGWATSYAGDLVVHQLDLKFAPGNMIVKVGDTVTFTNDDTMFHNVFSLSDAKSFDLGMFAKGHSKDVVFDKAGTVEVECAIHPMMKMTIEVEG